MKCDSEYHFFILVSSGRTSSCDAQSPFKTMKWVVQVAELLQRAYCGTEHITLSQPSLSPAILTVGEEAFHEIQNMKHLHPNFSQLLSFC